MIGENPGWIKTVRLLEKAADSSVTTNEKAKGAIQVAQSVTMREDQPNMGLWSFKGPELEGRMVECVEGIRRECSLISACVD